ncbi:MAG: response regulator [Armatimonadetes bacterium]|nr:response regulator [Armatimonadota bacterium]
MGIAAGFPNFWKELAAPVEDLSKRQMKSILFVDDEPLPHQVAQRFLDPYYEVDTAASGDEALACLQRKEFALLISDIRMPGMNGFELIDRARELFPQLPCMVISTHLDDYEWDVARRSLSALSKPYELKEFLEAVQDTIDAPVQPVPKSPS